MRDHFDAATANYVEAPAQARRAALPGIVATALLACADAHAIVNGAPASAQKFAEQFAWAVALEHPGSGGVCTAQLVSPTWVLTAGHCAGTGMRIRIGSPQRAEGAVVLPVEAVRHPRYDARTGDFDVGLLRLRAQVAVAPVPVATRREADSLLQPDARAVIAGWGKRSPSLPFSPELIVSDVELRSLSRENSRFAYFDPVSGPCGGDSGGPLLLARPDGAWVLVGVASRVVGDLCAQGGGIGIYVSVGEVREFIEAHVTDLPR